MKKVIIIQMIILLFASAAWVETAQAVPDTQDEAASPKTVNTSYEKGVLVARAMDDPSEDTGDAPAEVGAISSQPTFLHRVLFYIPDRILDLFDIVRLRVRLGPGLAAGVRVTEPASAFIGGYESVWVGLPGPRMEPKISLPFGREDYGGLELSILNFTSDGRYAPGYSQTEIGLSVQPLIAGADIDVDPLEILDFGLGLFFIDIRGDDL